MTEGQDEDPYLWDRSEPIDEEVARFERVLSPLAWKPSAPSFLDREIAEKSRSIAPRRPWAPIAVVAVLFAAAAAAIGFWSGRQSAHPFAMGTTAPRSRPDESALAAQAPSGDANIGTDVCGPAASAAGALAYEVLDGGVRCDGSSGPSKGFLPLGAWLETDGHSRVMLEVADIGHVEIAPSSKLRILAGQGKEHRLELRHGVIHARINAPPRLFIVETEAATAVDLGCVYTLEIGEDGGGVLMVSRGEVALEKSGASMVVERGMMAELRPGHGPGTPFSTDTSADVRRALTAYDFEGGPLASVLEAATSHDVDTLVSVLDHATLANDRVAAARRIGAFVTLPSTLRWDDVGSGKDDALLAIHHAVSAGR